MKFKTAICVHSKCTYFAPENTNSLYVDYLEGFLEANRKIFLITLSLQIHFSLVHQNFQHLLYMFLAGNYYKSLLAENVQWQNRFGETRLTTCRSGRLCFNETIISTSSSISSFNPIPSIMYGVFS